MFVRLEHRVPVLPRDGERRARPVGDERQIGRDRGGEDPVDAVRLPRAERMVLLRRGRGGLRGGSTGRDALRVGRRDSAVGVERHVPAGLDDEVAAAVLDRHVAGADERNGGLGGIAACGVVAKLRIVADERTAVDDEVLAFQVVLDIERQGMQGGLPAVRTSVRVLEGAAVDRDDAARVAHVDGGLLVVLAGERAAVDHDVAALRPDRAALGRLGRHRSAVGGLDGNRSGGGREDVAVRAPRPAVQVDGEVLVGRVDDRFVHVREKRHRAAVRRGRDGLGERRVVADRVGGRAVAGDGEDRGLGRGGGVGRRVGVHRAVVGGGRRVPREERMHRVVRDVVRGIGVRRGLPPDDGRRVGRVGAVGGLVVPRDRVLVRGVGDGDGHVVGRHRALDDGRIGRAAGHVGRRV